MESDTVEVESEKLQETNEEVRQWEFCFFSSLVIGHV